MASTKEKIDLTGYKLSDKDDFLKMLKSNLAIAKAAHKEQAEDWDRFIRQYRMGKSSGTNVQATDRKSEKNAKMIANYVFNSIQTIISATHDKRAEINLLPRGMDDEGDKVEKVQALLDYSFDTLKIYEKVNEFVFPDSLLTGQGYVKAYWEYEGDQEEKTRKVIKTVKKGVFRKKEVEIVKDEKYKEEKPLKDDPAVDVKNPYRIYKMPDADTIQESEWIFEEIPMKKDLAEAEFGKEFEADYEVETYKDWKQNNQSIREDETKRVRIYEGWGKIMDKNNKVVKCKAMFTDKELLSVVPMPYDHGKFPYIELPNYKDFHSAYNISEVRQIERLQNELDTNRQTIATANKKAVNPQRRVEKGAVDAKGLAQLRDPRPGVLVEVKAGKMGAIQDITPNQLGADVYNYDGIIKEDIARATGINEYESGGNERQVESATGVAIMSEATQRRIREKVRKLERFYEELAEMLIALYLQYGDRERMVKISGDKNARWEKVVPKDIIGEYDYISEAGSTMPVNREARSARWLSIYKTFSDNEFINKQELTREALKESGELKDVDKFMKEEPEVQPEEPVQQENPQVPGPGRLGGMMPGGMVPPMQTPSQPPTNPMMGNMAPPVGPEMGMPPMPM